MKKTEEYYVCDYCFQTAANRCPINQYVIIGSDNKVLSSPIDLHSDCERSFYEAAVFIGHFTDIHIGLRRTTE
jgi:hypothetical protein